MFRKAIAAAALLLAFAALEPAAAQRVRTGMLNCDVSGGIGFIIGSQRSVICTFSPDGGGPPEVYTGTISRFGLDIGATAGGQMVWARVRRIRGAAARRAGRRLCRRDRRGDHCGRPWRQCAGRRFEPPGCVATALGQRTGRAQSRGRRCRSAPASRSLSQTRDFDTAMQRPPCGRPFASMRTRDRGTDGLRSPQRISRAAASPLANPPVGLKR